MSVCVCSFLTVFGSLAIGGAIGMVFESASTANSSEDSNNNPGVGEEKICGVFAEILNNNQDFFRDNYKFSIEETNRLYQRIFDQKTWIVVILLGGMVYAFDILTSNYQKLRDFSMFYVVFILLIITLLFTTISIWLICKALKKPGRFLIPTKPYISHTMPNMNHVLDTIRDSIENYRGDEDIKSLVERDMNYAINIACVKNADKNRDQNEVRFNYLSTSNLYLIFSSILLFVSFLIIFGLKFFSSLS